MLKQKKLWLSIFLSALCFPMAFYSEPFFPLWLGSLLIWAAYVPLIVLTQKQTAKESFKTGFAFGFFSHLLTLYWIGIAISKYGNISISVASVVLLLLVVKQGLFWGTAFWALARMKNLGPRWLIGTLIFSLLEWVHVYFPFQGFPWCTPGYALAGALPLIQIVDVTGIFGLNVLIFLSNFLISELLSRKEPCWTFPRLGVVGFLFFFSFALIYGTWKLGQKIPSSGSLSVSLTQGNVSQDKKWLPEMQDEILDTYLDLTQKAVASKADLIIWPEAALPIMLYQETSHLPFAKDVLENAELLFGAVSWGPQGKERKVWNSAWSINSQGAVTYWYGKQHLVPFGEYVPLSEYLPIRKIVPSAAGNFAHGTSSPELGNVKGHPFGILICYESLFSDLSLDYVKRGAQFLVNITNDAWFDQTSGPYQHLEFGRFRAIETRRVFLRSANTGISGWFDAHGRLHQATKLFSKNLVNARISLHTGETFYLKHPLLLPFFFVTLLLLLSLGLFKHPTERKDQTL